MKKQVLGIEEHADLTKYISFPKRRYHKLKEATRQITRQQIAKLQACKECQAHPVLYIRVKLSKRDKRDIGVCAADWERLSDTVIGWSGE